LKWKRLNHGIFKSDYWLSVDWIDGKVYGDDDGFPHYTKTKGS